MKFVHRFLVPADHPALAGHFPGHPIVPGVMLLDEVLAAIGRETGLVAPLRLERVKFTSPVAPGEEVAVLIEQRGAATVAFACTVGERQVLAGSVAFDGDGRAAGA